MVVLETETYVRQAEEHKQAADVASSVDNHSYNPLDKIQVLYIAMIWFTLTTLFSDGLTAMLVSS